MPLHRQVAGINPESRQHLALRHIHIGGGIAHGPPDVLAIHHTPRKGIRMAQQPGRPMDVPPGQQTADASGAHRRAVQLHRRNDVGRKAQLPPHGGQQRAVPAPALAKGVVKAHHHMPGLEGAHHPPDKVLRGLVRHGPGKGKHAQGIHPIPQHKPCALGQGGQHLWRLVRAEHRQGMGGEGAYSQGNAFRLGQGVPGHQ